MAKKSPTTEDRKSMSFREAEGTVEIPAQLGWGQIDRRLRLRLWDVLYTWLDNQSYRTHGGSHLFTDEAYSVVFVVFRVHVQLPIDEAEARAHAARQSIDFLKRQILDADWDECLDLVQTVLRHRESPRHIFDETAEILASPQSPYLLIDDPPTIIPKGSPDEGDSIAVDLQAINASSLSGARAHLILAVDALNSGDHRGAIRESIHSVESASRIVTKKTHATLPDCLIVLQKERDLHPALKKAFDSLYGYTSDEKGIRHALLEGDNEKVGADEALFMFSACTAFVSYLARKFPETT